MSSLPTTDVEALRLIWNRVLGPDAEEGRTFFELGGDSLRAITIIFEVEQQLGLEVDLAEFLADGTFDGLVRQAEAAHRLDT